MFLQNCCRQAASAARPLGIPWAVHLHCGPMFAVQKAQDLTRIWSSAFLELPLSSMETTSACPSSSYTASLP